MFEKILSEQIVPYLDQHKLPFNGQHGFRRMHSCERPLHKLLSDVNSARDKRLITLILQIDYKKAFDTVYSNLLLLKLGHYGFSNLAMKLICDYFKDRYQSTRVKGRLSSRVQALLGVPQGSNLGPLFSLLFINDLAYLHADFITKLFNDDTSICHSGENLANVIKEFQKRIQPLET